MQDTELIGANASLVVEDDNILRLVVVGKLALADHGGDAGEVLGEELPVAGLVHRGLLRDVLCNFK